MSAIDPLEGMASLLDAPSPAVLVVYGADGSAIVAPVWFRVEGDAIEVVIAAGDSKVEHLQRDPRCVLMIFETTRPFRGLRVRGSAVLVPDTGSDARRAIASRYLGADDGTLYADIDVRPPGFVLRLPLSAARTWDLSASLPDAAGLT